MRQAKKIAQKDRATVRPVGVGTLSNRAPQRNRPPVRFRRFRPERLRRPDPERPPPRTRLTKDCRQQSSDTSTTWPGLGVHLSNLPNRSASQVLRSSPPFGLGNQRRSEPCGIPIVLMLLPVIEVPTSFLYGANWESRAWSVIGKQVATGKPNRPDTPMSEG